MPSEGRRLLCVLHAHGEAPQQLREHRRVKRLNAPERLDADGVGQGVRATARTQHRVGAEGIGERLRGEVSHSRHGPERRRVEEVGHGRGHVVWVGGLQRLRVTALFRAFAEDLRRGQQRGGDFLRLERVQLRRAPWQQSQHCLLRGGVVRPHPRECAQDVRKVLGAQGHPPCGHRSADVECLVEEVVRSEPPEHVGKLLRLELAQSVHCLLGQLAKQLLVVEVCRCKGPRGVCHLLGICGSNHRHHV
mmetsp:Transcript_10372/g.29559  ORF Transcript_10372/g.29559 Transcript_10372/m.29559 type:complete len:248 (+) Transcript_10372:1076-1819(+)